MACTRDHASTVWGGGDPGRPNELMSHPTHSARVPGRGPSRGRLEQASMKNTCTCVSTPLYQHVRYDTDSTHNK